MVTGRLRTVLWVLGSLASLWLLLCLAGLVAMSTTGEMMQGMGMGGMDGPQGMGMGTDGPGMGWAWMVPMMGAMAGALIALLGLVGIFIYLIVDTLRDRRDRAAGS